MKTCFALVNPILAALALFVVAPNTSHAGLLFSTLGQTGGGTVGLNFPTERWASDFLTGASATTATSTSVRLFNDDTIAHSYTASIFNDAGGMPGTLVGSFSSIVAPAQSVSFANFTGVSTGISLAANTIYWEVLKVNETYLDGASAWQATPSQTADFGSVFTPVAGTGVLFNGDGGSFWDDLFADNQGMFSLETTPVPEISSTAFTMVLACTAMAMRRRGRQAALTAAQR